MDLFRKGNFETFFLNKNQYLRIEYLDELSYHEWWLFNKSETLLEKINDEELLDNLENTFLSDSSIF
jgi:hypothetical protein